MGVIRSLRTNLEASGATKYKGAMVRAAAATSRFAGAAGGARAAMGGLTGAAGVAAGGIAALAGGAAIGAAVKSFADFDEAMTKSQAIMGELSDDTMARMKTQALDVSTTMVQSAEEAAESYFFLSSAGLDAQQSIKALPTVARFAQAGLFNMSEATEMLTDAQSALGLSVDDATQNMKNMQRVSDVLVKANTEANATVRQFAQALTNRAAPAMRSMNIEIEEGVAVLAAFADQGLKGRRAGTQLARILRIISQQAGENREAFEQLGIIDAEGNLRNLSTILKVLEAELEGTSDATKSMRLEALGFTARVQAAIKPLLGMSGAVAEYERNLRLAQGTTGAIAERQMDTLNKEMGLLADNASRAAKGVGRIFEPVIRAGTAALNKFFSSLDIAKITKATRNQLLFTAGVREFKGAVEEATGSSQTLNAMVTELVSPFEAINLASVEMPSIWDTIAEKLGEAKDNATDLQHVLSKIQRLRIRFRDEPFLMPGIGPTELRELDLGHQTGRLTRQSGRAALSGGRVGAGAGVHPLSGFTTETANRLEGLNRIVGDNLPRAVQEMLGMRGDLIQWEEDTNSAADALTNDLLPALSSLGAQLGDTASRVLNFATQVTSAVAQFLSTAPGKRSPLTLLAGGLSGFAGFFQHGGGIPSGQFGVVGEAGPEIVQGPATVSPGGMTLQVDASGLPEPQTPFEVARDRQWLRLLSESNDVLRVNKGGL